MEMTNINHPQNIVFPEDFHPLLIGLLDHFCKLRHLLVLVLTDKDQKRCWLEFNRLTDHTIFFALNQSLWGAGALMYHRPGTWGQCVFMYLWYVFVSQTKILRPMWADVCLSCQRVAGLRAPCEESAEQKCRRRDLVRSKGTSAAEHKSTSARKAKQSTNRSKAQELCTKHGITDAAPLCVCVGLCATRLVVSGRYLIFNQPSLRAWLSRG